MEENEKLRLEDAKWFAEELGKLTRDDQSRVFSAKTIDSLRQVYGGDADRLWRGRESWRIESSLGNHIDIPEPRTVHLENTENSRPERVTSAAKVTAGAAIIGSAIGADRIRNRDYYKFKKEREEFVKEQVEKWKENKDETVAKSEEGARNRAINEYNDKKLAEEPEKFEKWAKKHKDPDLEKAIKKKEILERENPRRDKKDLNEYLEKHDIKNPEKTHRPTDNITQEEASQRLEKASDIGMTKLATPAAAAAYLEGVKNNTESQEDKLGSETTDETLKRIDDAVDELKHIEKIEREQAVGEENQPTPQQPAPGSSFNMSSNQSLLRPPRIYRRAQRVRRRYGAGDLAKGAGKKAAKRGAMALGRAAASNPYVVGIGIAVVVIIVSFFILIVTIKHACDVHSDLLSSIQAGVTNPIGAAALFPLMLIGREVGLCEAPYSITVPPNPPGVTTEKEGPSVASNSAQLTYTITVTYDSSAKNAISFEEFNSLSLFDVPLYDYAFIRASGNIQRNTAGDGTEYIQWVFAEQAASQSASYEFELTLSPNEADIRAINTIYVSDVYKPVEYTPETPGEGPITSSGPGVQTCGSRAKNDVWYGADCLPTNDTCGGRWSDQMYGNERLIGTKNIVEEHIRKNRLQGSAGDGYNFGDPLCSFKAAKVDVVIDSLIEAGEETKARGEFWKDIAYCEGTPNSFGAQALEPGDNRPMGPAGYFQMNIGTPMVFKAWQKNNPIRGDVPWQRQIQNAIEYNNRFLKGSADFSFWGAAKCLCAYPGYRNQPYCKDLYPKDIRPIGSCNPKCQERGEQGPTL